MRIEPTFCAQLKRVIAEIQEPDGETFGSITHAADIVIEAATSKQQKFAGDLFNLVARLPNPVELGAQLGRRIPLTSFGDAFLGVRTAPTLSHMLKFVTDIHQQVVPLVDYSYVETNSEGRFSIGFRAPLDGKAEAMLLSLITCMADTEIARYTGRTGNIKRLELTANSKGFESTFRKYLSITPDANHVANVIVIERTILDMQNPSADSDAFNSVMAAYDARAELQEAGLAIRMRERIMARISDPPLLDTLAKSLNMTPRQVRLALARENSSYQEILRSCRVEYATALFKNPSLSVSDIAHRLGYSDLSAFTHSFSRWTGKSPSAYRIEMLAAGTPNPMQ